MYVDMRNLRDLIYRMDNNNNIKRQEKAYCDAIQLLFIIIIIMFHNT